MEQIQQKVTPIEVEHICIVVKDREKAIERIDAILGVGFPRVFEAFFIDGTVHGRKTACTAKLAFAQAGGIEIELIEPGKGPSIWRECLRTKGEGVHHIGAFVPDLNKELTRFEKMGICILQHGEDEYVRFAFMDTERLIGVILELLEHKY